MQVTFSLEQAVEYVKCIQNSVLQHGVAAMMWQMFVSKKLATAAHLVEKVEFSSSRIVQGWCRILSWKQFDLRECVFSCIRLESVPRSDCAER